MASQTQDRWLWLGFGVVLFLAAKGIRHALQDMVQLTAIDLPQEKDDEETPYNPEDAISLETLKTLISSTNLNIANAAKSIVVNRYARLPNAYELLSQDALSSDPTLQQRARSTIRFLRRWPVPAGIESVGADTWTPGGDSHGDYSDDNDEFFAAFPAPELLEVDESVAGWTNIPRERGGPGRGDENERATRRRRREAMVFRDDDGWDDTMRVLL